MGTALAVAAGIYALSFTFDDGLVAMFNREGTALLAQVATPGLRIYFLGFVFAGVNIAAAGYMSATERARRALLISVCRGLVLIVPLAAILPTLLGMTGVWLAFVGAELLTTLLCVLLMKRKSRPEMVSAGG